MGFIASKVRSFMSLETRIRNMITSSHCLINAKINRKLGFLQDIKPVAFSTMAAVEMDSARELIRRKNGYIIDCDGVLYHGDHVLPGAKEFITYLRENKKKFLFLTNASDRSQTELARKFDALGIGAEPSQFYTSAISTAMFLRKQKSGGRAFVIGEEALKEALRAEGTEVVERDAAEIAVPDFLVVGETIRNELFNYDTVSFAVKLVRRGARLIGTNEDTADRLGKELLPGTGSLIRPIEATSGYSAYFVGKPNPLMVASALERLRITRDEALVVGDRMNTDIKAGVEASVDTVLVLSGITAVADITQFAFRPSLVLASVADIVHLSS